MKDKSLKQKDRIHYIVIIATIFTLGFFYGLYFDDSLVRLITKPSVLITFMIYIIFSADFKKLGVKQIFLGHIFSVFGDLFLEIDPENLFLFGLGSFLIGHICYVIGFIKSSQGLSVLSFIKHWSVGLAWSLSVFFYCYDTLGDFTIPVLVYSLAISLLWMSGSHLSSFRNNLEIMYRYSPLLGASLFSFSDTLIALSKFRAEIYAVPVTNYVIIITYWLAQFFISVTAVKHHNPKPEKNH